MPAFRLLGFFPHPDDESYSCGGTFARAAATGAQVQIVCATGGEAGEDVASQRNAVELGRTRREELAGACGTLGALAPRFLGLPDGELSTVDFAEIAGQLIAEIRAFRPHVVVTLGADGVYGHPDHIALHRLVIAAFGAAGGGERFPGDRFGEPWTPARLFFAVFPRGMFRPMYDHMLGSEYAGAIRGLDPERLGVEPQEVAAAVDIRDYAERKRAAIACHHSQLKDGDPLTLFPGELVRRLMTTELFALGAGELPSGRWRELFEGLEA